MQRKQANAIAILDALQSWEYFPDEYRTDRGKPNIPEHLQPKDKHPADFLQERLPNMKIPRGDRHLAVWDWAYQMEEGEPTRARVEIWPRGGSKSTIAEQVCAYLACSLKRRFALYVCGTQDQADLHVQAIAAILEKMGMPRAVNAYSASINWTAQRLQTASGFGVIGVGLNSRVRGARLGEFRPDLIILDDVDETHDSPKAVEKKLKTITSAILPAGSSDATVLFIQNRIHKDSAIAKVADGRAEILLGASVTQEPAVIDLEWAREETEIGPHYRVLSGQPTWEEGQDLAVCEKQINEWGLPVFLSESQHEDAPDGGLWKRDRDIDPYRVTTAPDELVRLVIGVDPTGSTTTEAGIVAVGRTAANHYYVLHDDSGAGTTDQWVQRAIARYHTTEADTLVVERNFGGDMVESAIHNADPSVGVREVTASRGKLVRAEPVQQLYERGKVHHVGHFPDLENEMCRWKPGDPSPNRLDALVWAATDLMTLDLAFNVAIAQIQARGEWQPKQRSRAYLSGIAVNPFTGQWICQIWDCTDSPVSLVAESPSADQNAEASEDAAISLISAYRPKIIGVEDGIAIEQLQRKLSRFRLEPAKISGNHTAIAVNRAALSVERREVIYPLDWKGLEEMSRYGLGHQDSEKGFETRIRAMAAAWVFFHELDPRGKNRNKGKWINNI